MIDVKTEKFTAAEAVKAGLIQSVRSGAVRIEGNYTLTPKGLAFKQKKFSFVSKTGQFRVGKFSDENELYKFEKFLTE